MRNQSHYEMPSGRSARVDTILFLLAFQHLLFLRNFKSIVSQVGLNNGLMFVLSTIINGQSAEPKRMLCTVGTHVGKRQLTIDRTKLRTWACLAWRCLCFRAIGRRPSESSGSFGGHP
ncbi:hypothetical protein PILCRDRAFT_201148 [Piloderma croceum F 1598]|uniref:Uncharacterized protein n=1 Tax=Piloderma croceum (strain F 1598) TaxID=765440 RepID=A0A0C3CJJ8_PILCF|nr:hypothetical protein PILCRDRAFT_201148 [Piloderma croceum F 1598]